MQWHLGCHCSWETGNTQSPCRRSMKNDHQGKGESRLVNRHIEGVMAPLLFMKAEAHGFLVRRASGNNPPGCT